ncbi:MAG: hypothetical protein PHY25_05120 [Dehalococcoidales bacterium]|nr:hypothetical protein [Dehalococcoidales bacterium]MDD4466038.1 hypothetical protein [Dehalococcoidales bacterium]
MLKILRRLAVGAAAIAMAILPLFLGGNTALAADPGGAETLAAGSYLAYRGCDAYKNPGTRGRGYIG